MPNEWKRDAYVISDERGRLDITVIHRFLSTESYWASGRSVETVQRTIANSLPFGLYRGSEQIGFARVVTDYATFAWLADVFVLKEFRRLGLAKWLIDTVVSHPELQGLRRWVLGTRDAHNLYRWSGFAEPKTPEFWMERLDPTA
ncbi:MAG: GNAT family N-acetyltransferase [Pyrinomonadaceae bacterium]